MINILMILKVKRFIVDQSDVESSYTKLTEKEAINIIKNGSAIGFVQYNKSAKITKIVFYSSAIIE